MRTLLAPLSWVALVDWALAPVALVVAAVAVTEPLAVLCVLPLAGLLHMLGAERRRRIDESLVLGRAVEDAAREARSDPLTGVGNRLAWQEAIDRCERRLVEDGVGSTVVLVDLNRLKETNDTYGHDVGDRMIQALAVELRDAPYRTPTCWRASEGTSSRSWRPAPGSAPVRSSSSIFAARWRGWRSATCP